MKYFRIAVAPQQSHLQIQALVCVGGGLVDRRVQHVSALVTADVDVQALGE